MFQIKVNFPGAEEILKRRGLDKGGRVQRFFTVRVMTASDKYCPFRSGTLVHSARISADGCGIEYDQPYARYHWYGKLMVDKITGKGSFYNPKTGRHFSRPGVQKELTNRDMNYRGAPLRGSRWVERMWIDRGETICRDIEKYMNGAGQ